MAGSQGKNGWIPYDIGIMIIDEDPLSLLFVETLLKTCHFRVESFSDPVEALHEICKKRGEFDLVIADLHMVAMPGFSFVERIAKGLKLPVINGDSDLLHQALHCGACFHIVKPITINNMEFVWKKSWRNRANVPIRPLRLMKFDDDGEGTASRGKRALQMGSSGSMKLTRDETSSTRKKDDLRGREEDSESEDNARTRLQWDYELHERFLVAISLLGSDAVPTSIIGIMNVAGLTTKQVASHLQKHRKRLMKEKQAKEREKCFSHLIPAQKFPTCLSPANRRNTNNQAMLMNNQEVIQHQPSGRSLRRAPFILPKPSATTNTSERSTILHQHSSSFQNTPLMFPSTSRWFDFQNDTIESASSERSTLLQTETSHVHEFHESSQTGIPSILQKSFTDPRIGNSHNNVGGQFMNFGIGPIGNNHNMGTAENYSAAFPSNVDGPSQIGNSPYGHLGAAARDANRMKEPRMLDAANGWPSLDEFPVLNNEFQVADQKELMAPGTDLATNSDFGFNCDFKNFRDLTFDDSFLAEILNDIDKGGTT